jgi:CheY-like chemotaxis protein/DNA-binding XRE family transcriptional regulator
LIYVIYYELQEVYLRIEEAFGIVIKRLRKERDFSQEKLSLASSMDRGFISNIEGGKQQPSLLTVFELAKALGVTSSRIMIEVECILKFNGNNVFKHNHDKNNLDWVSCLENIMHEMMVKYEGTETILVADDEKQLRDLLYGFFTRHGYKVILAEDGQEAIDKYNQHIDSVKITLMDIVMPRKDGISSSKEIKTIHPDAKIIFMSGYLPNNFNDIGDEYKIISKPFNPIEILKEVRTALDANAQ